MSLPGTRIEARRERRRRTRSLRQPRSQADRAPGGRDQLDGRKLRRGLGPSGRPGRAATRPIRARSGRYEGPPPAADIAASSHSDYVDAAVRAYLGSGGPTGKLVVGVRSVRTGWQGAPDVDHGLYQTVTPPTSGGLKDSLSALGLVPRTPNHNAKYVFNPDGGLGVGSYYQDPNNPIQVGVWIHVVGSADSTKTYIFINGAPIASDVYQGTIQPQRGTAPMRIGTRDFNSFFEGEIREVRVWNRTLTDAEVARLYASDSVPQDGLVAEYLLTQDIAPDTAGAHAGDIYNATWKPVDARTEI